MKRCSKCQIEKPLTEFYKDSSCRDGLRSSCKSCFLLYQQTDHGKEVCRASVDRYQKTEKGKAAAVRCQQSEKRKTYNRLYQLTSPVAKAYKESEHGKAVQRKAALQWKKTEKGRASARRYDLSDKKKAAYRRWERTPNGKAYSALKDAKRRAVTIAVGNVTAAEWQEILARHNHQCAYCGRSDLKLTRDHYIPLKLGGQHIASNIVPACQVCNSKKSARHPHRLF